MNEKERKFLAAMLPILERLNKSWFPSDEKSPEGLFYACTYCDQGCSSHDSHDADCLAQLGKDALIKMAKIDADPKYEVTFTGEKREPGCIEEVRSRTKINYLLKSVITPVLTHLPTLDYSDPVNSGVVCTCFIFMGKLPPQHHEDCAHVALAEALSDFLTLKRK